MDLSMIQRSVIAMITSVARHDPARSSLNAVGVHTWTSKSPNRRAYAGLLERGHDIVPSLGIERSKDLQGGRIKRRRVSLALWSTKCKVR